MSRSECVMTFSAACQRHMLVRYCCDSGSTNKFFVSGPYFYRKSEN